jgi:hypothetical protein
MDSWWKTLMAPVVLGLSLCGCAAGAMQQAVVSDSCKAGDPACSRAGFDAPIAVGASTRPLVHLDLRGSAAPGFHLESAAPSIISVDGGNITGRGEGMSALLFVSDSGAVLDFLHVWVKAPQSLRLSAAEPGSAPHDLSGVIEMLPGESIRISATPVADGQDLLGSGESTWAVEPAIARLFREGSDGERRLVAKEPGKALIRIKSLGVESTLELVVASASGRAS